MYHSMVHVVTCNFHQTELKGRYLHATIQPFIQFANLLSQLLHVIGFVQDVRIHLGDTQTQTYMISNCDRFVSNTTFQSLNNDKCDI